MTEYGWDDLMELSEEVMFSQYDPDPDYTDFEWEGVPEDDRPLHTGRRKGLLKKVGRRKGLYNLYDSPRFDCYWVRSRMAAHPCHKDDRTYRPWQRDEMRTIRGVPDNDFNEWMDFVEGVLQSAYQDSEILVEEEII